MPRKKNTAAQREEALASASVRDQIEYEYPNASTRPEKPLPAVVDNEASEPPRTLLERTQEAQRIYWELLSDLEDSLDVELDSTADLQSMTHEDLKKQKGREDDAQAKAQAELETLLPGVIKRESIATGYLAIFSPEGKCLAYEWVDALRVWKEGRQ